MGAGAFLIACIASSIGSLILMFPLAALVIRSFRKVRLGWGKGLGLLGIAIAVVSVINFVWFRADSSLLYSSEMTLASGVRMFLIPLLVSFAVVGILWRPRTVAN